MELRSSGKPVEQIVAAIQAMDLGPIKVKLMDAEDGHSWTREYADTVEIAYKRFLTLLVKYPETTIAPDKEIDKFWHAHILDTMKYADDCQKVFGYFLHHFPYFGMRGAEDAARLEQASQEMQRLYAEEFNDVMPGSSAHCFAAQSKSETAHCFAAQPRASTAHCFAAVSKSEVAHCFAAKPQASSAHCFAAMSVPESAHCFAAQPQARTAHCFAAVSKSEVAHCFAAQPEAKSAHCFAAKPMTDGVYAAAANADVMARPTLALAA